MTEETMKVNGHVLHRIRALRDIDEITEAGTIGGWIENENNLDQDGDAWVYGNARVYGSAQVYDAAQVYGAARVCDNTWVCGSAQVYGSAHVYGAAQVSGNAWVYGSARVCDNAQVSGAAQVFGSTHVFGNAAIRSVNDYLTVGPIGSRSEATTFFHDAAGEISVACGCFSGTLEEFRARVEEVHGGDKYGPEYRAAIELVERVLLPRLKMEASEDQ